LGKGIVNLKKEEYSYFKFELRCPGFFDSLITSFLLSHRNKNLLKSLRTLPDLEITRCFRHTSLALKTTKKRKRF